MGDDMFTVALFIISVHFEEAPILVPGRLSLISFTVSCCFVISAVVILCVINAGAHCILGALARLRRGRASDTLRHLP